jgi:hypothetical protein
MMEVTANQGRTTMKLTTREWGKIFPDQAMTLAAIDRVVHHSTIQMEDGGAAL